MSPQVYILETSTQWNSVEKYDLGQAIRLCNLCLCEWINVIMSRFILRVFSSLSPLCFFTFLNSKMGWCSTHTQKKNSVECGLEGPHLLELERVNPHLCILYMVFHYCQTKQTQTNLSVKFPQASSIRIFCVFLFCYEDLIISSLPKQS